MKISQDKQLLWAIGLVTAGAIIIWDSLVHLATRQDPIFGDVNNHDPKWIAGDVLVGIFFLIFGLSCSRNLDKNDDS